MFGRVPPNVVYLGGIPMIAGPREFVLKFSSVRIGLFHGRDAVYELPLCNVKDVTVVNYLELVRESTTVNKSVIGRGVAGGLLLGPLGAIVGGMSGVGTKQKLTPEQRRYKNDLVVVVEASDAGVDFRFGLIAIAAKKKTKAAAQLADAIQNARLRQARDTAMRCQPPFNALQRSTAREVHR